MPSPPLRRAFPTGVAVPAAPPPLRRWRTLAGGAALGGVLVVGTAFLGSTGERTRLTPLGPSESVPDSHQEQAAPQRVVQPEAGDPTTAAPVGSLPPATTDAAPAPGAAACPWLFEEPARLAQLDELPPVEVAQTRTRAPQGSRTDEAARTVFRSPRPDEAHTHLRALAARCGEFPAALPDGTAVTVQLVQEGPAYRLAVSGGDGPDLAGWLAIERTGEAVSVWRLLYPAGDEGDGDEWDALREQWRAWWRDRWRDDDSTDGDEGRDERDTDDGDDRDQRDRDDEDEGDHDGDGEGDEDHDDDQDRDEDRDHYDDRDHDDERDRDERDRGDHDGGRWDGDGWDGDA